MSTQLPLPGFPDKPKTVELLLTRVQLDSDVTIGTITLAGKHICWTCEDPVREIPGQAVESWKIPGQTAIPTGRYEIRLSLSNRFKKILPELLRVPGFTGIRIHPGNLPGDTEGCLLPGLERRAKGVGSSGLAMREIERWLLASGKTPVFITIANPKVK